MSKVFLNCVYKKNLGDDIFIKLICDRYKDSFFVLDYRHGKIIPKIDNLKTFKVNNYLYRYLNKIAREKGIVNFFEYYFSRKCDAYVTIGGSLFMEPKNYENSNTYPFTNYLKINVDKYVLGSNIGPVYSNKYIEDLKNSCLINLKDACFRDEKSYSYVKDLPNTRLASDIVFSLDVSEYKNIEEENKVIISVIDLNKKADQIVNPNLKKYESTICEFIKDCINRGFKVELMSFCKSEGDEIAINRILEKSEYKNQILTYFYDGNIDNALKEIATSKVIVGTRFHANILGFILNKTVFPIIYNDKTRNLLEDLNFKGKCIDIDKIDEFDITNITDDDYKYKISVENQINDAQKHFEKLDKILERK